MAKATNVAARLPAKTRLVTSGIVAGRSGVAVRATITAAITATARRYQVFLVSE